jgi:mRNA interferase RelE/StbE
LYDICFKQQVKKDFKHIERQYAAAIVDKIKTLEKNPFPKNSRKLTGTEMSYRLRVGDYRIIYQVDVRQKLITIFYVRHRKDAYK